ncbi:hypothetical protein DHD80_04390 [Gramella sp. AN32]|nr:hypothetical protein [Gramella sp. AN32]
MTFFVTLRPVIKNYLAKKIDVFFSISNKMLKHPGSYRDSMTAILKVSIVTLNWVQGLYYANKYVNGNLFDSVQSSISE